MDNLRKSIKLYFGLFCPDKVIQNERKFDNSSKTDSLQNFLEIGFNSFNNLSLNEIQNIHTKISEDWLLDINNVSKEKSPFNLLIHFSNQVLLEDNNEPFVNYEHLLKWRDLSYQLGEDLFTCSHFAYTDHISQRFRTNFSWRQTVFSNNKRLKHILNQGLAENHFHLKGSGPVFDLSWLSLMNGITYHHKGFSELKKDLKLLSSANNSYYSSAKELHVLVYKASYIRKFLFEILQNRRSNLETNYLIYDSNTKDSFDLLININAIQQEIETLRYTDGHVFKHFRDDAIIDYAIPKNIHYDNLQGTYALYGERKFLYDCFRKIFELDTAFKRYTYLFHAYLLIKNSLRSELIQVNNKIGFGNFAKYQDRKEYFLHENSIYHTAFVNMAVNDTVKYNNIKSFEARIAPKDNYLKLNSSLNDYAKILGINTIKSSSLVAPQRNGYNRESKIMPELFFTVHFIKKNDRFSNLEALNLITPRHNRLRIEVKNQSRAIVNLREKNYDLSSKVRGIDAASSEFAAKPEVFAQAFRFLKNHKLDGHINYLKENLEDNKLYATYHVGEDFYDIVDGLRSIGETIVFLNMSQGDRIGHGLALGIDVSNFYKLKEYKLMMPKEVVLDNIVWLLANIRRFGIDTFRNEVNRLEKIYESLFHEIYTSNIDSTSEFKHRSFSHGTFYDAWKLRGDDPMLYFGDVQDDIHKIVNITYWDRCRINQHPLINNSIRYNIDAKFLYQQYHFNAGVKKTGRNIKQFAITTEYISLVTEVQKSLMNYFSSLNIGIETNPTSNYVIGTFKRYSLHPISKFFNLGLCYQIDESKSSPQLSVSINTDDQGIFSTSLENEYALMAIAMEKEKDSNGLPKYNSTMIYDWLNRIREMGLEQSFKISIFKRNK